MRVIELQMRAIVASDGDVHSASKKTWEVAFTHAPHYPYPMWPLWLIWGALTDRFDLVPQEKASAVEDAVRASKEWLALDHANPKTKEAYLDRWVHVEL